MQPDPDVVLSSGFLAFAEQAGFLRALEERAIRPAAVVGTSSGALAGALWCAGMPARTILDELCAATPLTQVRLCRRPWTGLLSLQPVMDQLAQNLPRHFDGLTVPLGVGVVDAQRQPVLLTTGALVEAVAASCAIPVLFAPVVLEGRTYRDGGVADRTALTAWQQWRPGRSALLHLLDRTSGAPEGPLPQGVRVFRSPRSGAALWDLGDVEARYEAVRTRTLTRLDAGDAPPPMPAP